MADDVMIEFCGIFSDKCKRYIRRKTITTLCVCTAAVVLGLSVPLIIAGILGDMLILTIPATAVVCIFGAVFLFDNIKTIRSRVFAKIVIRDGIISVYCETASQNSSSRAKGAVSTWEKDRQFNPPSSRAIKLRFQTTLAVGDDNMNVDYENPYQSRPLTDVKKVIDMGEWYRLVFFSAYKNSYFVCQKDLLVSGTLDEFEKLFEGKSEKQIC